MQIGYFDPLPKSGVTYTAYPSPVELARNSDILFLCAAGGPGVKGIASKEVIEALGPKGIFVNIARGWLHDEPALVAALKEGRLSAAGLDVFEHEPEVPAELMALDNVVLTPHIASSTVETQAAMGQCVLDNLASWFAGKGALTPVT
jgi:hydroxypyruvate reductase